MTAPAGVAIQAGAPLRPAKVRRPVGFAVLAFVFGWVALGLVILLIEGPSPEGASGVALRLSLLLETALGLTTVEALWRCRPWVFRTVAAFTGTVIVRKLLVLVQGEPAVPDLVFFAFVMTFVLNYVHGRATELFGRRRMP